MTARGKLLLSSVMVRSLQDLRPQLGKMYCAGGFAAMQLEPLGFVSGTQRDRLINCNHAVVPLGRRWLEPFSQAKPLLPIEHLAEKFIQFPLAIKLRLCNAIEIG